MNKLKFILSTFDIAALTLGINSCNKLENPENLESNSSVETRTTKSEAISQYNLQNPLLVEIYDVLYNSKPIDTTIIKNLELFRENGDSVSIASAKNLNELIYFTFKKGKDENLVSCCKVDILGYNQYDETKNLIMVAEVEHYTSETPDDQYFYEFQLRKYALDGVTLLPLNVPKHRKATKTDCFDDLLYVYGFSLNASTFTSGKYKFDFSIGWDFPTYSVTCGHDSSDIQYGWPF